MLPLTTIEQVIRQLLARYHGEYALLIGSYARGDATEDSDIDVVVFGGSQFKKTDIFAFAEDLREMTGRNVDAFEICEVNAGSPFYEAVMREGRRIA